MEDKEMQAQFIQWLAKKTGAKTEEELKQVLTKLQSDKGQMQQVVQQFQSEMSGDEQSQPTMKNGGKFDYLKCLSQFKKGGKVGCGCGGAKMEKGAKVPKAFLGSIISAVKGAGALAKGTKTVMDVSKGAQGLYKAGKIAKGISDVAGVVSPLLGTGKQSTRPMGVSTNAVGDVGMQTMPNINTPTMPSFTVGMVNNPNQIPGGQVLYQGATNTVQNATPKLVEKGTKLKARKLKK